MDGFELKEKYPGMYRKTKGKYIFPNAFASFMKGVSPRTQYESSMMSIVVILIGMVIMGISILFSELSLFIKIVTVINVLAAWVFLSSHLITAYQQYLNYLEIMDILE